MQQINNLTGLRAFAALSVMLLHVRYGYLADIYGPFAFFFKNQALGVDIFFVLSGFILAYVHYRDFADGLSGAAARSFLWARLARIYPVHLFMLLVVAFVLPKCGLYQWSKDDTLVAMLANIALIHAWGIIDALTFNQVSWTISAEWFAYLCFPLIAFATRDWRTWMFIALAAFCILIAPTIVTNALAHGMWAVKCLTLFTLGFCAFRIGENIPHSWLWRAGGIAIGPLLVLLFWLQVPNFYYLFLALTAAFVLCLFKAGPIFLYANPASVYLGKISYSLYMSHVITFMTLRTIAGGVLQLRFEIPIIVAVAAAIYHLVEEPARHLMRARQQAAYFNRVAQQTRSVSRTEPDPEHMVIVHCDEAVIDPVVR